MRPRSDASHEPILAACALSLHPAAGAAARLRLRLSARPHIRIQLQADPRDKRSMDRPGELSADPVPGPVLAIGRAQSVPADRSPGDGRLVAPDLDRPL